VKCWFCEKNETEHSHDIEIDFERYDYNDRQTQRMGKQAEKVKTTLVVPRCNACYEHQQVYNSLSLFVFIPGVVLAASLFMLFSRVNEILVFLTMAMSVVGFGIVVYIRRQYLKEKGVKAMIELEMRNEDIQKMLADGWYRI